MSARWREVALIGIAAPALGVGLGSSSRLTYHEAIVAQQARELLQSGDVLITTLNGLPWLEKPPLSVWLTAALGWAFGGIDETVARVPSALAATALALAVSRPARRRFGPNVGLLAGLVQITTSWTVVRGRLAEVDIVLAALVTAALVAFDRIRREGRGRAGFFILLGLTALAKGVGFGAALVLATAALTLVWDRDRKTLRVLAWPLGWALAALIASAWPLLVLARCPDAWDLWVAHSAGRLGASAFAGEPWGGYLLSILGQTLPWTPLAILGAWRSQPRRFSLDRLLWAWALVPAALVSLTPARNSHYLIYALPPWSIWAAASLARIGARLSARDWSKARIQYGAACGFAACALAYGLGYGLFGRYFDQRGVEWGFYADAGRLIRADEPLLLLYNDYDRDPYPTPFGPVPHDLAVRLFYLGRGASCRYGEGALTRDLPAASGGFAVLGRDRDLAELDALGRVEVLARGPRLRARRSRVDDRCFVLYRVALE